MGDDCCLSRVCLAASSAAKSTSDDRCTTSLSASRLDNCNSPQRSPDCCSFCCLRFDDDGCSLRIVCSTSLAVKPTSDNIKQCLSSLSASGLDHCNTPP